MRRQTLSNFTPDFNKLEYIGKYNNLISRAFLELKDRFGAIASPTLSKQETVTHLYLDINCSHSLAKRMANYLISLCMFLPRLIYNLIWMIYVSLRYRVNSIPTGCFYFRTWLEPRCIQEDKLIDDFFRELPNDLDDYGKNVVVAFYPTDFSLIKKATKVNNKDNYIISLGLLNVIDVLKIVDDYIRTALVQVKASYDLDGRDISTDINRSLLLDYLNLRSFTAYVERAICIRLQDFDLEALMYVYENQSWEKACCLTMRNSGTRLIGYQSSGFSPEFLNFFPTKLDAQTQAMPDVILTVGENFTKYILDHGNYNIPVKTFSALRFSYPTFESKYIVKKPNPRLMGRILYAFSVHVSQYKMIIDCLIDIFKDTDIHIDLKFHPMFVPTSIKWLKDLPSNFGIIEQVDNDLLSQTYDCVIFNDNSFGLESLFMGVRSYQFNAMGKHNDERFIYFELWDTRIDQAGLLVIRDQILGGNYEKMYNFFSLKEYMNSMYRPYLSDIKSFFELIGI